MGTTEEKKIPTEMDKLCYIRQKRALKRLKAADEDNLTAYIYGVTGIGKTELYTQYLKNRRYTVLDARTMTQEDLHIEIAKRRRILVIDNLHEMTQQEDDEEFRQAVVELVGRPDIWLILVGRSAVPPWLTAARYHEVFYVIDQAQLLFDDEMAQQYVKDAGIVFSPEQFKLAKVNCAGVALCWNMTKDMYWHILEEEQCGPQITDHQFRVLTERTKSQMWDYLEYHVYDQWDVVIQEFLMEMSIVDGFTVHLAEMITGRSDVEPLLSRIQWIGNFMQVDLQGSETIYRLRMEVQISMKRRLRRKFSQEKVRALYENAGLYYQLQKQPLKALEMYEAVEDTERIASLLIDNVRIAPNNGYYYELKKYYLALPEETIRRSPELMCGMSMLQSLLLDIPESERWYHMLEEYAKTHTGSEKKAAKSRLVYLDIGLPHRGSEEMVGIIRKAYTLLTDRQIKLQEFSVTSNQASQMNGGKDFCEWSKKDRELVGSIGKIMEVLLGRYGKGMVNLALAESFLEKGEDNYEVSMLASKGRMQAEAGGKIEQCFVGDGLLAWLHILNGKVNEARELLLRFRQRAEKEEAVRLLPNIDTFLIRCELYVGEKEKTAEWLRTAPDEELGFCIYDRFHYMTKIRIYIGEGRNEQAAALLERCAYYAQVMKRTYIAMETELLRAIVQYRMGDRNWQLTLANVLTRIESYGFVRLISREGVAIWPLLQETGWLPSVTEDREQTHKHKEFWKRVLEETKRMAAFYPRYLQRTGQEPVLSQTMIEILQLLAQGMTKECVAQQLHMSTANVKYHTQQLYRRLGVSSKAEAVREAGRRGVL